MLSDSIIWRQIKSGKRDAFAQLYQRYVKILYSYGKKITRDEKLVEDTIQDLFIDLWQSRENLGEVETARFYLFRSLRRRIYKAALKADSLISEPGHLAEDSPSHETELIGEEESSEKSVYLDGLIRSLPGRQEEAVLLYFYQNFEYHEVAEILSINEQSARNLVSRAIEKLKKIAITMQNPIAILLLSYLASHEV